MRTIDADEFKKLLLTERDAIPRTFTERYEFGVERKNHFGDAMRGGIRKALRCMEQCPTLEVEPVKHGRWTENHHVSYDDMREENVHWYTYTCSECDFEAMDDSHYCPNCGARMDLEETK